MKGYELFINNNNGIRIKPLKIPFPDYSRFFNCCYLDRLDLSKDYIYEARRELAYIRAKKRLDRNYKITIAIVCGVISLIQIILQLL